MASLEQALEALKDRFLTIVQPAYPIDVKFVGRQYIPVEQIPANQYPALIIEVSEDDIDETASQGHGDVSVDVDVWGYVQKEQGVGTALNELNAAMIKSIYSDVTLGGAVAKCSARNSKRNENDFIPYGLFKRRVVLFFRTNLTEGM